MIATYLENFLQHPTRPRMNYLNMMIHADEDTDTPKFRASDAGRCRLYRYWKRQRRPQPGKDITTLKVMEMGNLLHAWLDYALDSVGVLYNAEITVEDPHVKGHVDALVGVNGHVAVYDYKTIGGRQAYYMLNNGCKAKREHQYQVLTYLDMINNGSVRSGMVIDAKEARIAYISREAVSSKHGKKYPPLHVIADMAADLDLLPAVRQDWQILIDAWDQQQEPQATPEQWECKYCPYSATCDRSPFL